jgi:hypothetical protein
VNANLETETAVWPMCRQNCDGHRSSNKYNYNERQVSIGQRSVMGNLNLVVAQELWVYIYIYRYVYILYIYVPLSPRFALQLVPRRCAFESDQDSERWGRAKLGPV